MLRTLSRKLFCQNVIGKQIQPQRSLTHYPIDETIFGLTDDQIKVIF